MASSQKQSNPTTYDLQPLEDALSSRGLDGIYTRDFMQKLSEDTAKLRAGELSLVEVKNGTTAPLWLRNPLTNAVNAPNPGLRAYAGHWYNSYLRITAHGYGKGPDLVIGARHNDGRIGPPDHIFDPTKTCAPVQLTSHALHQDNELPQKQRIWKACTDTFHASKTRTLLQLQITTQHLQSGSPRIDRVVCMGLGSFTRQTGSLEGLDPAHRPYFQHIVALSIAEALDDMYKQHSECYGHQSLPVRVIAQDPNYSESDKTVLAENGITVLDDPDGLLAIVKNTFVMSAFPSFPLYEIIADMLPGGPAAIFDASLPIDGHGDSTMAYNDFAAPRVRRMVALYRIHSFKWDEQELSDLNQKMHESMHWLSRMHLFFQPNLSGVDELSPIVVEDIQSREDLIKNMVPSGFQVLRQLFVRSIWG